jgi:hypothetical protein
VSDAVDDYPADHSDESIDTHPDLIDPEWNERVEREARKAVERSDVLRQPAKRDEPKPRRGRRSWFGLKSVGLTNRGVSALLGLLIVVGLFVLVNRVSGASEGAPPSPQGAVPVGTAQAAATPTGRQHSRLNLNTPFANTPAAGWSDGAAGLQAPAPVAVGKWSVQAVAAAEASVKQTLIAAHLDPAMLVDHQPTAYLADLAPNARSAEQTRLNTPNNHDSGSVSMLAGGFHLLPAPIKVDGSMSAGTDPRTGALVIHTNYVFAFAFDPGQARDVSEPWQIVAVQHVAEDFTVTSGSGFRGADKGVWPTTENSYVDQIGCTESNQGYLAPAFADASSIDSPRDTGDPDALYAPTHSLNIANSCPAPPQHA